MNKIRVIAAIVDVNNLTLYKENGDTVLIAQGDHRLVPILNQIKPIIAKGEVAEIDLDSMLPPVENNFTAYEEKSGGFAKFFKVAKEAVKKFFNMEEPAPHVEPEEIGTGTSKDTNSNMAVDDLDNEPAFIGDPDAKLPDPTKSLDSAIDEVLAHAVPASSPDFHLKKGEEDTHEVVAIVQKDNGTKTVIPGADNLNTQLNSVLKSGNDVGLKAMLSRLAAMPKNRNHSVEDLLKFLKRADLPLTDKGDIVIYKILNKGHGPHGLNFVDCHSGKVYQGPGARVQMSEDMVDPNRSNECSQGLHVARRSYLRQFGGTTCLLGIIRPEDVIAVPNRDADKMRVCAYHLICELSADDYAKVKSDNPLGKDNAAGRAIAKIIAGKYDDPHIIVNIGGAMGTNLTYTEVKVTKKENMDTKVGSVGAIEIVDNPAEMAPAAPVDPKAVAKEVVEIKQADTTATVQQLTGTLNQVKEQKVDDLMDKPVTESERAKVHAGQLKADKPAATGSPRDRIAALLHQPLTAESAAAIHAIKRKAKKSYDKLGIDEEQEKIILAMLPKGKL